MTLSQRQTGISHIRYEGICPPQFIASFSLKSFHQRFEHLEAPGYRSAFANEIGVPYFAVAWAQQVHGANIASVREAGPFSACDGLATDVSNLLLLIAVADCLPVYLWDNRRPVIALLHAGWRGSAANIARRCVEKLHSDFGTMPQNIGAILGPCICPACYEVGTEVAEVFSPADVKTAPSGRLFLDLRGANRRQLLESGVLAKNIYVDPLCTSCRRDKLFSYRAEGGITGRRLAVLAIR